MIRKANAPFRRVPIYPGSGYTDVIAYVAQSNKYWSLYNIDRTSHFTDLMLGYQFTFHKVNNAIDMENII